MSLRRRIAKFLGLQTQSEAFIEIGVGIAEGIAKGLSDDYEGGQRMNKLPITDSALFDLIVLIIEDETRTKAHSIEMIRNLLKLTEDNE